MTKRIVPIALVLAMLVLMLTGCGSTSTTAAQGSTTAAGSSQATTAETTISQTIGGKTKMATGVSLDDYMPKKKTYYFAYTYKLIHPWYDAIKVGIDAAITEYAKEGITITYDYTAPVNADAVAQINMIESAVGKKPDAIAVDVNQVALTVPVLNKIQDSGIPVLTFSGGDATKEDGSKRIAFIGNTDNKGDGAKLAEELAKAINYEGEVACLDGTIGASSHEERIVGFNEVMAKYPNIKVVDRQRDDDDLEKAVKLTENFIQKYPNLKGIWCNNMTNPIGAAQAVVAAGKKGQIQIVGMDHDLRTLQYVEDGTILCAQVQNNFDMGFYLVMTSLKAADGETVGGAIKEERYNVGSTTVFQSEAKTYIDLLYGDQ